MLVWVVRSSDLTHWATRDPPNENKDMVEATHFDMGRHTNESRSVLYPLLYLDNKCCTFNNKISINYPSTVTKHNTCLTEKATMNQIVNNISSQKATIILSLSMHFMFNHYYYNIFV